MVRSSKRSKRSKSKKRSYSHGWIEGWWPGKEEEKRVRQIRKRSKRTSGRRKSVSRLKQKDLFKYFKTPRRLSQVDIIFQKVQNNFQILRKIIQEITAPRLKKDLTDELDSAQSSMNIFMEYRKPEHETQGAIKGYVNLLKGTNNTLVNIRNEIRQKTPQNPNLSLLINFEDISKMT